jgi:flap endonuclease-1
MGIDGLPKLITTHAGKYATDTYDLTRFKGMIVAVDASSMIYQTVIASRSSGKDLRNKKGGLTSHLNGLFYKIIKFLETGIKPIFVYDGKPPEIKNMTIAKRRDAREKATESLKDLSDSGDELYIRKFKQSFRPTQEDFVESRILLDLMGIPYIIAPGEADPVCAWLTIRKDENGKRYAKGICSDDSDMLALGGLYLFKDMAKYMANGKKVTVINLNRTLHKMKLTKDQFQDMSVLLGCDYCSRIKGFGPKKAYEFIRDYDTLENVLDVLETGDKFERFREYIDRDCMIAARDYFRTVVDDLDLDSDFVITDDNVKVRNFQSDELIDFLCTKHNFDFEKIHTGIERLKEAHKKLHINRKNTKNVHKILEPNKYNYMMTSDVIEILPDLEESDEKIKSKKYSTHSKK